MARMESDRMPISEWAQSPVEPGRPIYQLILLLAAVLLLLLPFVTTFNEFLTALVIETRLNDVLAEWVVPTEVRFISVLLQPFGIGTYVSDTSIYLDKSDVMPVYVSWNCVGWQSLILFAITLVAGLSGPHTASSKVRCIVLGLLGIFWLNLLRITLVIMVAFYFGRTEAVIFHDYGGTVMILLGLALFWYFAINYVLEPKDDEEEEAIE